MKLKNMSNIPTVEIVSWLSKYSDHFSIEVDDSMRVILNNGNRPFVNHPKGILICNPHDLQLANVDGLGGLAYPFGAVSVFVYPLEKVKWNGRSSYLYENRILHEILHHFNQPCHNIYAWFDDLPRWKALKYKTLWYCFGSASLESYAGSKCAREFYKYLLRNVHEDTFDEENMIEFRDYEGTCYE